MALPQIIFPGSYADAGDGDEDFDAWTKLLVILDYLDQKANPDALLAALALKAPLGSPAFTGLPSAPTAPAGTNTQQIATTAFVRAAITALVNSSPAAFDTLKEFADALGDDPNFAATVTNALALKAPLDSPVLTGTPRAPTPALGANTNQIATAAMVTGAINALVPGRSFRNRIRNGAFTINQRAVSGTVTLAAGAYGHDGFKAGASGCTYTFSTAASGDVTLTITAGTLLQVIEGGLYLPEGGAYTASWTGTATARAYQGTASGSYVASPLAVTGLTAGTNATIEFGLGTLSLVQFEPGTTASAYERRDDELRRCQRYYEAGTSYFFGSGQGTGFFGGHTRYLVQKRGTVNLTVNQTASTNTNGTSGVATVGADTNGFAYAAVIAGGSGAFQVNVQLGLSWTASAEL